MKTVKPQKLGVLVSPFEVGGEVFLCITTMLGAPFDAPESPLHEAALWRMLAAQLGPDTPVDLCRPKPVSEVVVIGSAHPRDPPQEACSARLTCGEIDKTLWVAGALAGFAPLALDGRERREKAGTYDRAWREEAYPGLPRDFDLAFYHTAPPDQRLAGHFAGDEVFTLENMHPTRAVIRGRLPSFVPRAFVSLRGGELREVPMRMDTLQLYPDALTMVVLYRGVTRIAEDDASDVLHLVAACDAPGALRPIDHYRAVLAERLDMKKAAEASLRQADLMPPGPGARVRFDEVGDPELRARPAQLRAQNARRKAARELEAERRRLAARGEDPDAILPREIPPWRAPPVADDDQDAWRAELREEATRTRAKAEAVGRSFDAVRAEGAGPPELSAGRELSKLQAIVTEARRAGEPNREAEARLADPGFAEKLRRAERAQREAYRRHAHERHAAPPAGAELTERARIELPAGAQGGVCFEERDLTGVDLRGLDLRGVDLRGAFLEGAVLEGCDLRGADLSRAVFARAKLDGADLSGAKLVGANLGKASLAGAKIEGDADLSGAVLVGADLSRASLRGARLARADLSEARLEGADLSRAVGEGVTFAKVDLGSLTLTGARLPKSSFLDVDATGADFSGADLTAATFQGAKLTRASFRGANLHKLRAVRGSTFDGADFRGAKLGRANLRFMSLVGCDLEGAEMDHADLSGCDLSGARLRRVVARGARFARADLRGADLTAANLMRALMAHADLRGADLTGANLFRADLCRAEIDRGTTTKDANLTQIRLVDARRTDEPR